MTWFQTVPTFLAAVLVIFVPGAILARALGARGLTWLAVAAPLSVSLAVLGPIAANIVKIHWNPLVLAALTLSVSAFAWGIRSLVKMREARSAKSPWSGSSTGILIATLGGLLFGATVITVRFMQMFVAPGNISQTYDNVYHLSAVRAILESGNGSVFAVGSMVQNGPSGVYPFAWHNLVALTTQITNVPIPVAVNSVNMVIGALVWTVSSMYLTSRVAGTRPAILWMTGVMAGAFGAFPYLAVDWGVLYPNFLAIALLPTFMGLVADVLKISVAPRAGILQGSLILAIGAPGLALAHPNILMALAAFVVPMALFWMIRCLIHHREGKLSLRFVGIAAVGLVAYLVVFVLAWDRIRPSVAGSSWPPTQTIPVALREVLATSPLHITLSWPVLILTVIGLVAVCVRPRQIWVLGVYLVGAIFFVVVSSFPAEPLRHAITGVFFNDSNRPAALLPVIALPLVAIGSVWVYDIVLAGIPKSILAIKPVSMGILMVATLAGAGIGIAAQNNQISAIAAKTTIDYTYSPKSMLLSPDELTLLRRAVGIIPKDATVIAQPATGASLFYALEGRKVILPAISSLQSPPVRTLLAHLPELDSNPAVCEAVRDLDSFYVFDFGSRQVSNLGMPFPSSEALANTVGLTLIDEEGPAKLYRIDGCQ